MFKQSINDRLDDQYLSNLLNAYVQTQAFNLLKTILK